ncbi:Guanine nucleotide-binding protein subunit gamma 1-like protein [Drosera capensis]
MTGKGVGVGAGVDARGKHRVLAELKRMEQETGCLEKELADLDKLEWQSAACEETNGPLHPSWDRWFEGLQEVKGCRCWIL